MTEIDQDGGMDLADVLAIIKLNKRLILAAPIVSGLAALIAVSLMRPLWEASVLLQVGQVGQVLLEPVTNVVSRMSHPSFIPSVLNRARLKPDEMRFAKSDYQCSLKVAQVKGSDLVEVKLRSYSADMARNLTQSTVANLQAVHDELFSSALSIIQEQIKSTNNSIRFASGQLDLAGQQLSSKTNPAGTALAAITLQNKSSEFHELTKRKLQLEEQVGPLRTFATRIVGDIYVSEGPVSPNKPLIVAMAILAGLLTGVFVAFARHAIAKAISGTPKAS